MSANLVSRYIDEYPDVQQRGAYRGILTNAEVFLHPLQPMFSRKW